MATSVCREVFDVAELLFMRLVTGPLEHHEDLLRSLGDVDARVSRQKTLLHVAVGLGKMDWVEGLLEKGANPELRDVEGISVMELAKSMGEKYPEDGDRQSISKLVRLVMKVRESVSQGGCNTTSTCQDTGMEAMEQDMISDLSRKMSSRCESMNDIQSRIATNDTLRVELTTNRDLINDVKNEISTVRKSIDDVKTEIAARDVLLSALESSVTSMANKERPVGVTPETSTVPGEVVQSTPRTEEEIRRECVEAMMRKTRILNSSEEKMEMARGWYKKLYYKGDETACLLKFLKSHDDLCILIDFDSRFINRMKSRVRDHDGVKRDSIRYRSFADFEEKKVYLGVGFGNENMIIAHLARALAQMSVCLAFNNGGRPYAKGDDVTERRMKKAIKEAEEEYSRDRWGVDELRGHFDWFIEIALRKETQRGKEVHLTSAVPHIIALYGSTEGTPRLQRQLPSLLELFRDSVMAALIATAQV